MPILLVRTADTTGIKHGDAVIVSGTSYTIREIRVDGEGMTEIVMSET